MPRYGTVVAFCTSLQGNVPKYPQEIVIIGAHGIVGDFHAGPTRISRRTGKEKFNDRQISLVAKEALEAIGQELNVALKPGDFGENITTQGLGTLADIQPGAHIQIGESTILEVTEQNDPCVNLQKYHTLMVKTSYGRRGLLAIVKQWHGEPLAPGISITVL